MKTTLPQTIATIVVFLTGLLLSESPALADDLAVLKANASKGDAPAQTILGSIYSNGRDDVDRDEKEGLKWARLAANQGYAPAHWLMGDLYAEGIGVEKDEKEAVKWYRKAADQGLAVTQYNLGVCYLAGQGVGQDEAKAAQWFRKAADQEHATAQSNLGFCFLNGQGVGKDEVEAVKWFRKAAKNGSEQAQLNLAICHFNGLGLGKDMVLAHAWASLAEDGEEEVANHARELRSQLESAMSAAQIVDSAKLIKELMAETDPYSAPMKSQDRESSSPATPSRAGDAAGQAVKMVKSLEFDDGGTGVDASLIRGKMLIREGGPFSDDMIEIDIKRIQSTGLTQELDIRAQDVAGGVNVTVKVIGSGDISDIDFMGNTVMSNEDLQKKIEVKAGDPVDDTKLAAAQRKIADAYEKRGCSDVLVSYNIVPSELGGLSIVIFQIDEGALTHDIRFEGNTAISSNRLRGMVKTREQGKISNEDLQTDIKLIERAFQDEGYTYAKVTEFRREPVSAKEADIVYVIDEGAKYDVARISLSGNTRFTQDELMKGIRQKAGSSYKSSFIKADEKMIQDYYRSRGYADARVETSIEDDGKNTVKIDYSIEEGGKSTVGQINIDGNVYVTKDIILHELNLAPGDVFNAVLIDKARETLKGKGYFRELGIFGTPTGEPGRKNLDIQVLER
ncbi:MAG TPA: hypothetical protein DDZ88_04005 [Verrucomicrobiales bacterium]|nr:hypothetical protein [Verrucomicrobiales bacterium]